MSHILDAKRTAPGPSNRAESPAAPADLMREIDSVTRRLFPEERAPDNQAATAPSDSPPLWCCLDPEIDTRVDNVLTLQRSRARRHWWWTLVSGLALVVIGASLPAFLASWQPPSVEGTTGATVLAETCATDPAPDLRESLRDEDRLYTVASGDTLSAIAFREYGDAASYMQIYSANRLGSPDRIVEGSVLRIPPRVEAD